MAVAKDLKSCRSAAKNQAKKGRDRSVGTNMVRAHSFTTADIVVIQTNPSEGKGRSK